VLITGDTRYDQASERARRADLHGDLLAPLVSRRPTLVAGSTWPPDEEVLLPAWLAVRGDVPDARLIIAPHEPAEEHLEPIEAWARSSDLRAARLGQPEASSADVVIVDRVGALGDLYALARAAYVGGGFHTAGLHSVLEPAAFGAPVVFGPHHEGSRDATLLLDSGAAQSVSTVDETIEVLSHWLGDAATRDAAGAEARALVAQGVGAAERSYQLVMALAEGGYNN
jgi:3-deoxy-D-manno-octulosonic-acid transferase